MKKLLFLTLLSSSILLAQYIDLKSGWNLIGAKETISKSSLNKSCINLVYTYENGSWKEYYRRNTSSLPSTPTTFVPPQIDKSTSATFSSLSKGQGFWVHTSYNCKFSVNSNSNNKFDGIDLYRQFCWGCHGNKELDEDAKSTWEKIEDNKGGKGYLKNVLTYEQLLAIERDTNNLRSLPAKTVESFPYYLTQAGKPSDSEGSSGGGSSGGGSSTGLELYNQYCYNCHGTRRYAEKAKEVWEKIQANKGGMGYLKNHLSYSDLEKIYQDTRDLR